MRKCQELYSPKYESTQGSSRRLGMTLCMQQFLISLYNTVVSRFLPLETMKGGNFVPSAFAVRQTETRVLSCPVVFTVTFFYLCHPLL